VADLQLALATIDDLPTIVDLATAHDPDEPPDPKLVRFSWLSPPAGENAAILHLNGEMGYQPIDQVIELHRELGS
jgi:hypothetical protein